MTAVGWITVLRRVHGIHGKGGEVMPFTHPVAQLPFCIFRVFRGPKTGPGRQMRPASRKEKYGRRPGASVPRMTWSKKLTCISLAASFRRMVTRRSDSLGFGSPEG